MKTAIHPEYPGYIVYADGRVFSRGRSGGRFLSRIMMKGRAYYHVSNVNGKKMRVAARFVLEAFVGPCPSGHEACHNDGDCLNDAIENLRWGTHSENMQDRIKHGRHPHGAAVKNAVLDAPTVRKVRELHGAGLTWSEITQYITAVTGKKYFQGTLAGAVHRWKYV